MSTASGPQPDAFDIDTSRAFQVAWHMRLQRQRGA
jgi:hypothetical protein